jgi:hypothetical protein
VWEGADKTDLRDEAGKLCQYDAYSNYTKNNSNYWGEKGFNSTMPHPLPVFEELRFIRLKHCGCNSSI